MSLLEVDNLSVSFSVEKGTVEAVKNISFTLDKGETLALVGESGAGKSVTAHSILQLLPYPQAFHPSGSIRFRGEEIIGAKESVLRSIRGNRISMIFQEPMTSLNPLHSIIKQVSESLILHQGMDRTKAHKRAAELLHLVQLPEVDRRKNALPHELSGGQRQRVMIAMALANEPDILIADEPTTALDVTIQAQILKLLKELQQKMNMALLLITHDLGIVKKAVKKCCVMTQGQIVERGLVHEVFNNPVHEYTKQLLASEPKGEPPERPLERIPLLEVKNIKVFFPITRSFWGKTKQVLKAVNNISLLINKGETTGLVGESGSGKSTLGYAILKLLKSEGHIIFSGQPIHEWKSKELRPLRKKMQIVFQDPFGSLNPRLTIFQIVEEGLLVHNPGIKKTERDLLIDDVLTEVGIDPAIKNRYPHEFSGGQRQRISIARSIVLRPDFIVLDEPTSSLDLSVQARIIDLLTSIQKKYGIAYLFISHDLRVVKALSYYVAIMEKGIIVEHGPAKEIFSCPRHPYTQKLLGAAFEFSQQLG